MSNVTCSDVVAPGGTRAAAWTSRSSDPSRTIVTPRTARRRSPVLATVRSARRWLGGPVKMRGSCCFGGVLLGAGALRRAVVMSRRLEVDHEGVGALGPHVRAGPARDAQ